MKVRKEFEMAHAGHTPDALVVQDKSAERSLIKPYRVGSGIGSLAAAAFMIRDGGLLGENITILEALPLLGGSLDGAGDSVGGYSLRGGRMLTTDIMNAPGISTNRFHR